MNRPKISIITINYNNVSGLEETILSVKNQTYPNMEYVVVDGMSDDGSDVILDHEAESINVLIRETDTGIFNAMNKGIANATGDYLLFLNSGDVFTSKTVLNDFINHPNFEGDIIYGDYKFSEGGKVYPDILTPEYFMRSSLPHQSTLIHNRVFKIIGGYDESYKIVGDREHFFKAFLSNKFLFNHVPIPLSLYDLSGISNVPEFKQLKAKEDNRMFQQHLGLFYEDYLDFFRLKKELNIVKGKTIKGIFRRIIKKLKKLF
ncbi:glycosyltransferase family 2 protein [Winogradskyella sp.]|uniref:glycosyltransferase family 2 protein n=1 Tax=Winogradskyella sp. TaxID=1883156 RepID=UPI003AA8936B